MAGNTDTKIRFTVEGVNQLHQEFQKILTDSQSLTKEWEAQGTAIIQSLKEQLELLKQRNAFASPNSALLGQGGASTALAQDGGTEDIERALEGISTEGLRLSNETLKELAFLLKSTSIPSPTEGGLPKPSPQSSDETESDGKKKEGGFGELVSKFALNNMLKSPSSQDPAKMLLGMSSNFGSALMQSGGIFGTLIGALITGISEVTRARYEVISEMAPIGAEAARMFGGSWDEYSVRNRQFEGLGIDASKALQMRIGLGEAMGRQYLGENPYELGLWQQTTSLTQQDILEFARSARGSANFGIDRNLSMFINGLTKTGIANEKIQTQMSEYLKEIVNLNQVQVQQFGRANTEMSSNLYNVVAKAFAEETEASPEFAGRIAGSIYQGLASPKTLQTQALRWEAIRQANPTASWFDVKMMMEDPLGTASGLSNAQQRQRQQATQNYLDLLWRAGGDWNGRALLLQQEFGLSANVAGSLAQGDKIDFSRFMEELNKTQGGSKKAELEANLDKTVDSFSQMLAEWKGIKLGEDISDIRNFVEEIRRILGIMSNPQPSAYGEAVAQNYELAEKVGAQGGVVNALNQAAIESAWLIK